MHILDGRIEGKSEGRIVVMEKAVNLGGWGEDGQLSSSQTHLGQFLSLLVLLHCLE